VKASAKEGSAVVTIDEANPPSVPEMIRALKSAKYEAKESR
jgi:hypothetical protein